MNKTQVFESELKPLTDKINQICKDNGIPAILAFGVDGETSEEFVEKTVNDLSRVPSISALTTAASDFGTSGVVSIRQHGSAHEVCFK